MRGPRRCPPVTAWSWAAKTNSGTRPKVICVTNPSIPCASSCCCWSLGGSMLALWLTGWPLNFMAIMGMMMLLGVIVNDTVVLIDGYEKRRLAGEPLEALIVDGTLERLRHVIVTSVTTIAGLLPLAMMKS